MWGVAHVKRVRLICSKGLVYLAFSCTVHIELGQYLETKDTADIGMLVCYFPHLLTSGILMGWIHRTLEQISRTQLRGADARSGTIRALLQSVCPLPHCEGGQVKTVLEQRETDGDRRVPRRPQPFRSAQM